MTRPADISQEVWDVAYDVADAIVDANWGPSDRKVETVARAILAERERCALNIERRNGEITDRSGIAREIRMGIVIDERGVAHG